jgi:hypothetical protein
MDIFVSAKGDETIPPSFESAGSDPDHKNNPRRSPADMKVRISFKLSL